MKPYIIYGVLNKQRKKKRIENIRVNENNGSDDSSKNKSRQGWWFQTNSNGFQHNNSSVTYVKDTEMDKIIDENHKVGFVQMISDQ